MLLYIPHPPSSGFRSLRTGTFTVNQRTHHQFVCHPRPSQLKHPNSSTTLCCQQQNVDEDANEPSQFVQANLSIRERLPSLKVPTDEQTRRVWAWAFETVLQLTIVALAVAASAVARKPLLAGITGVLCVPQVMNSALRLARDTQSSSRPPALSEGDSEDVEVIEDQEGGEYSISVQEPDITTQIQPLKPEVSQALATTIHSAVSEEVESLRLAIEEAETRNLQREENRNASIASAIASLDTGIRSLRRSMDNRNQVESSAPLSIVVELELVRSKLKDCEQQNAELELKLRTTEANFEEAKRRGEIARKEADDAADRELQARADLAAISRRLERYDELSEQLERAQRRSDKLEETILANSRQKEDLQRSATDAENRVVRIEKLAKNLRQKLASLGVKNVVPNVVLSDDDLGMSSTDEEIQEIYRRKKLRAKLTSGKSIFDNDQETSLDKDVSMGTTWPENPLGGGESNTETIADNLPADGGFGVPDDASQGSKRDEKDVLGLPGTGASAENFFSFSRGEFDRSTLPAGSSSTDEANMNESIPNSSDTKEQKDSLSELNEKLFTSPEDKEPNNAGIEDDLNSVVSEPFRPPGPDHSNNKEVNEETPQDDDVQTEKPSFVSERAPALDLDVTNQGLRHTEGDDLLSNPIDDDASESTKGGIPGYRAVGLSTLDGSGNGQQNRIDNSHEVLVSEEQPTSEQNMVQNMPSFVDKQKREDCVEAVSSESSSPVIDKNVGISQTEEGKEEVADSDESLSSSRAAAVPFSGKLAETESAEPAQANVASVSNQEVEVPDSKEIAVELPSSNESMSSDQVEQAPLSNELAAKDVTTSDSKLSSSKSGTALPSVTLEENLPQVGAPDEKDEREEIPEETEVEHEKVSEAQRKPSAAEPTLADLSENRSVVQEETEEETVESLLKGAKELVIKARRRGLALTQSERLFQRAGAKLDEAMSLGEERPYVEAEYGALLVAWAKNNIMDASTDAKLTRAFSLLSSSLESVESDETILFNTGLCACLLGSTREPEQARMYYEKACKIFDQLLLVNSQSRIAVFNSGLAHISLGKLALEGIGDRCDAKKYFETAAEKFSISLELKPDDAKATAYLADCHREISELE